MTTLPLAPLLEQPIVVHCWRDYGSYTLKLNGHKGFYVVQAVKV
jgi:hypothetical protein